MQQTPVSPGIHVRQTGRLTPVPVHLEKGKGTGTGKGKGDQTAIRVSKTFETIIQKYFKF